MTYEQLKACYKTALKQRDEAEVKVKQLVMLIEDDLWPDKIREINNTVAALKKIGV